MGRLKLKYTVPGSSIVEVIVASIIFLAVFVISLSTVTGFTLRRDEGYVLLEAQRQLDDCIERYGDGTWPEDTYEETHSWGSITIRIIPYGEFDDIQTVVLTVYLDGSRKSIEHRLLTVRRNE
jgi:hypothetical protein